MRHRIPILNRKETVNAITFATKYSVGYFDYWMMQVKCAEYCNKLDKHNYYSHRKSGTYGKETN